MEPRVKIPRFASQMKRICSELRVKIPRIEPQIKIPRIENAIKLDGSAGTLNNEIFWIGDESKDIMQSQSSKTTDIMGGQNFKTSDDRESLSCDSVIFVEDEDKNINYLHTECAEGISLEKTFDAYYAECFHLFGELEKATVRIPFMKTGELKGGIPVVRVENEVYRVRKETKEQIENDRLQFVNAESAQQKRPTYMINEFNSSSVFFEKTQRIIDRAYFHVLSTELYGDDEICLSGMLFVDKES